MRFIFICRCDPSNSSGGTEIFARNLAVQLAETGNLVDLLYGGEKANGSVASISGVTWHNLQLINTPYLRSLVFRHKCEMKCRSLLSESEIDAVIAFGAGTFPSKVFDRIRKVKGRALLVYYAMDSMKMEFERSKKSGEVKTLHSRIKRWFWYNALTKSDMSSCNKSELILASSEDTINHLIADYNVPSNKINLLYEGIPDNFANGYEENYQVVPTFLHVGGGPRKGTSFFLKAMKLINDKYDLPAKAVILRASPDNIAYAKALDLDIDTYSYISEPELKRVYAQSTALVSPSMSEGFCLPVIEAAMFSKPSIVTNTGSLPELVKNGENGYVIPVCDCDTLANCMYQLAIDPEMREQMGEKAKTQARNFTIAKTASNLLKIISTSKA